MAFDVSRRDVPPRQYAEYKAKRDKTPAEFRSHLRRSSRSSVVRITFLKKDGYEADDIVATLTTQASPADLDVLILTGDREAPSS